MHTKLKIYRWSFIPELNIWKSFYLFVIMGLLTACSDFVEVELPKQLVTSETVFENPITTEAVLKNIYALMRDSGLSSGGSFNFLMGLYTDELDLYTDNEDFISFQNHTVLANNGRVLSWWNHAFNLIYEANALIEGVGASVSLMPRDQDQFIGEALFIRSYLHLLLVELYGDIPYITTSDYITNTSVVRMSKRVVYEHIIADLDLAQELLSEAALLYQVDNIDFKRDYERTRPYVAVAEALLARAYLYNEDWSSAEEVSTRVINAFGDLEPDLDKVFLKEASGTIWQFKPRTAGDNTTEGSNFILRFDPALLGGLALSANLFTAFEPGDMRQEHWIGEVRSFTTTDTWYYAFKYKQRQRTGTTSLEYSIQLRLAEQYLIRAEARTQQGDIPGAQQDLNRIRNRAGLSNTTAATLDTLLVAILEERRVELFTERGHRWFDLKRMGGAKEVLESTKLGWRDTDILLPIPEAEISLNPNLTQNNGY